MNRQHASATALGASALVMVVLLAQPARSLAAANTSRASPVTALHARAAAALATLTRRLNDSEPHRISLAVCHDCPASQALVRVLLRRQAIGIPSPALLILTDRPWLALDTLARRTAGSIVTVPHLAARVGVTPVAIRPGKHAAAIGMTDALALIATPVPSP